MDSSDFQEEISYFKKSYEKARLAFYLSLIFCVAMLLLAIFCLASGYYQAMQVDANQSASLANLIIGAGALMIVVVTLPLTNHLSWRMTNRYTVYIYTKVMVERALITAEFASEIMEIKDLLENE